MYKVMECFECEGSLSLDEEYLKNLSGGKFKVKQVHAVLSSDALEKLQQANQNLFDFSKYDSYLENDDQVKATQYFLANGKCISKEGFGVHTFDTKEQLDEFFFEEICQ